MIPNELCKAADLAKQPVAFKKHYYKYVLSPESVFYWTEKTDGLRSVLIVYNGCLYLRQKNEYILLDSDFPSNDTVVLDSEFYENKYCIFDCYYLNQELSDVSFEERYRFLSEWVQRIGYAPFCLKTFYPIRDLHDLEKASALLSLEYSPISGNRIDGIILQDNKSVKEKSTQYKWKRARLITTDFYVHYDTARQYYLLYVMGDEGHCKPMKEISRNHTLSVNQVTLRPISTPIRENMHIFKPRTSFDTDGYFQREIDDINRLMSLAKNEPDQFNHRIIEMSPAEDGWVPLRIREDKVLPNAYKTAFDNILAYFEYPAFFESEQYFEASENTEETVLVHNIAHCMRDCQFEHLAKVLPAGADSVLDIGSGRGGDFERLADLGFHNLFGIDDIYNCAKYAIRANKDARECNLNLIPGMIGTDNESLANEIRSRAEFPPDGFRVFNIDYAIHYILDIPDGLKYLRAFIRALASPDAVLIFTAFDGDKMMRDAQRHNPLPLGDTSLCIDAETASAKMILPTIKKEEKTEKLFTEKNLKDLGFSVLDSFYPLCEKEHAFSAEDRSRGLFHYYRYMRAYIVSVWDDIQ